MINVIKSNDDFIDLVKKKQIPSDYFDCTILLNKTATRNQHQTGRCWLEAGLDFIQYAYYQKSDAILPELSSAYLSYFDLHNKIINFLYAIYATRNEEAGSPILHQFLSRPVQDGGQWAEFVRLINKYGIVFSSDMEACAAIENTNYMDALINQMLRGIAVEIRSIDNIPSDQLDSYLINMAQPCFDILDDFFGQIPTKVSYLDKEYQPQKFYQEVIYQKIFDDMESYVNVPYDLRPFYRRYRVKWLYSRTEKDGPISHINIPLDVFKKMVLAQLEEGLPVWAGIDAGHMSDKKLGIFDESLYDYRKLVNNFKTIDKGSAALYDEAHLSHAVLIWGADYKDHKVTKWCVKNSFGSEIGQSGYCYMSDAWFDRYVYQVVIEKDISSKYMKNNIGSKDIYLPPWDFLGCLA